MSLQYQFPARVVFIKDVSPPKREKVIHGLAPYIPKPYKPIRKTRFGFDREENSKLRSLEALSLREFDHLTFKQIGARYGVGAQMGRNIVFKGIAVVKSAARELSRP